MKKIILTSLCLISMNLFAGDLGLGFVLGAPTGISGNYMLGTKNSIDAAIAFDLNGDSNSHIQSTYLFRFPQTIKLEQVLLGWFWGLGGKYRTEKDKDNKEEGNYRLGVRSSIGANHEFTQYPIELFSEVSITMNVLPKTDADFGVGIGFRYYF